MDKEFKWTDELVHKLAQHCVFNITGGRIPDKINDIITNFKASSQQAETKPPLRTWEILSLVKDSCPYNIIRKDNPYHDKLFHENMVILCNGGDKVNGVRIHSVKRDDGHVFAIGDKTRYGFIEKFFIGLHGSMKVKYEHGAIQLLEGVELLPPERKVLFVTHDGVNIYEGDDNWCYRVDDKFNSAAFKSKNHKIHHTLFKYFSTQQAAEAYISLHKPQFSAVDIQNQITLILEFNKYCDMVDHLTAWSKDVLNQK